MTTDTITHGAGSVATSLEPPAISVKRLLAAPAELVFKAFTEPERLSEWWGPAGSTLTVCSVDLRPGGHWLRCTRGADGEQSCAKATYYKIAPPERLVYTDAFAHPNGAIDESMPTMHVSVEFEEHEGGGTKLISRTEFESVEDLVKLQELGASEGIESSLNRLDEYLARETGAA